MKLTVMPCLLNVLIIWVSTYHESMKFHRLFGKVKGRLMSEIYGVPCTTIYDIKKNGNQIEEFMCQIEAVVGIVFKRKWLLTAALEKLDKAIIHLIYWAVLSRNSIKWVSYLEKAIQINQELNCDQNVKTCQGWL